MGRSYLKMIDIINIKMFAILSLFLFLVEGGLVAKLLTSLERFPMDDPFYAQLRIVFDKLTVNHMGIYTCIYGLILMVSFKLPVLIIFLVIFQGLSILFDLFILSKLS